MLKKFLFTLSSILVLVLLSSSRVSAYVDISLEDSLEEGKFSVFVDSNEEVIEGIDLLIQYSDDVTVGEVVLNDEFCTLLGNTTILEDSISIECFNDEDTVMSGVVLAEVTYTTDSDNYSFKIDKRFLDVGTLEVGSVSNIGSSEEETVYDDLDTVVVAEEESLEKGFFETVTDFLRENPYIIVVGVILLITIVALILGLKKKE
jgi:hypothetical protein